MEGGEAELSATKSEVLSVIKSKSKINPNPNHNPNNNPNPNPKLVKIFSFII